MSETIFTWKHPVIYIFKRPGTSNENGVTVKKSFPNWKIFKTNFSTETYTSINNKNAFIQHKCYVM